MPLARAAAERALQLDDTLAEAHAAIGVMAFDDWDWRRAAREFERALSLNPNLSDSYYKYGELLLMLQRFGEALDAFQRGHAIDPLSARLDAGLAWALQVTGRIDDAVAVGERMLQLDTTSAAAHSTLCSAYSAQGRFPDAIRECRAATNRIDYGGTWADLGYAYAQSGDRVHAREVLDRISRMRRETDAVCGWDLAVVDVALGEYGAALAALERDVAEHAERVPEIAADPRLKPLHTDPRFAALLRRMHLPL
jgi:tetratricopeptide (TPR) repeat protein